VGRAGKRPIGASGPGALSPRCQKLLDDLRKQCPEVPVSDVPAGTIIEIVSLTDEQVTTDVISLLTDNHSRNSVVWSDAESEVVVHFHETRVRTLPHGLMLIGLTLQAQETGPNPVTLTVPFALGRDNRIAGMLAVTESRPRGPTVLVDRWGDAVIATAWQALLDLAVASAASAGSDAAGRPLVPAALIVDPPRLGIVPRARFDFETASA
jgi:hypothetical protein